MSLCKITYGTGRRNIKPIPEMIFWITESQLLGKIIFQIEWCERKRIFLANNSIFLPRNRRGFLFVTSIRSSIRTASFLETWYMPVLWICSELNFTSEEEKHKCLTYQRSSYKCNFDMFDTFIRNRITKPSRQKIQSGFIILSLYARLYVKHQEQHIFWLLAQPNCSLSAKLNLNVSEVPLSSKQYQKYLFKMNIRLLQNNKLCHTGDKGL